MRVLKDGILANKTLSAQTPASASVFQSRHKRFRNFSQVDFSEIRKNRSIDLQYLAAAAFNKSGVPAPKNISGDILERLKDNRVLYFVPGSIHVFLPRDFVLDRLSTHDPRSKALNQLLRRTDWNSGNESLLGVVINFGTELPEQMSVHISPDEHILSDVRYPEVQDGLLLSEIEIQVLEQLQKLGFKLTIQNADIAIDGRLLKTQRLNPESSELPSSSEGEPSDGESSSHDDTTATDGSLANQMMSPPSSDDE